MRLKTKLHRALLGATLLIALAKLTAEAQSPKPFRSPEVATDHRVTFRLRAPNAKEVQVSREGASTLKMQKDDTGVWSVTTDPMEPDLYGYLFIVDGVGILDPVNPVTKPNLIYQGNMVSIPGSPALPWEVANVPHGALHRHFYHSQVVGDERDYFVYTPPGYRSNDSKKYPVLYLLHGYSDEASGWSAVGRAHVILDNLIASGKAKPMLVVMPLGYGAPEIVGAGRNQPGIGQRNFDKFGEALLTEVLPAVERDYHVLKNRNSRAIAGLSMGGGESLTTGLNHLDQFAWVGSFSGAVVMAGNDYPHLFPKIEEQTRNPLRLLWIACGTEDGLLAPNREVEAWLKAKNVPLTAIETPGAHTWLVWRRNLVSFAPLLFR